MSHHGGNRRITLYEPNLSRNVARYCNIALYGLQLLLLCSAVICWAWLSLVGRLTVLTPLVVEGLELQSFSYHLALFLVAGPVFFLCLPWFSQSELRGGEVTRFVHQYLMYRLQGVWREIESADPRGNNDKLATYQAWFAIPFASNARQTYLPLPWMEPQCMTVSKLMALFLVLAETIHNIRSAKKSG
eukprot:1148044-Pelagomonas_calceolata.AAC.6